MADYFALLAQPRRPWIDSEELKKRFLGLSADLHPDRVHESSPAEKERAQTSTELEKLTQSIGALQDRMSRSDVSAPVSGVINKLNPGILDENARMKTIAVPESGGSGKYAIAKNTLTLTYQEGTKVRLTFMVTKDELAKKTPEAVYSLNTKLMLVP